MSRLKSSCAFSPWTMSSGLCIRDPPPGLPASRTAPPPSARGGGERLRAAVRRSSRHRLLPVELGPLPLRAFEHLPQVLHRVPRFLEAQVERREAEAQDVGTPGAEVADHAARDQRLHDRVSAGLARETHLRAAQAVLARGGQAETVARTAFLHEADEQV